MSNEDLAKSLVKAKLNVMINSEYVNSSNEFIEASLNGDDETAKFYSDYLTKLIYIQNNINKILDEDDKNE